MYKYKSHRMNVKGEGWQCLDRGWRERKGEGEFIAQGEYMKCGSPISIRFFVVYYSTRRVLEQRNRVHLSAIFEKN